MSKKALKLVTKKFKKQLLDSSDRLGDAAVVVGPDALIDLLTFLRDEPKLDFSMLSDLTAVDYLHREPRYEVVYNLYSLAHKHRFRVRCVVEEGAEELPTATALWKSANWAEREVWDMYGIRFTDHPDLRRILLYEEFEGHPLRKDYPIQKSQPRMDLRRQERDALEEYQHFHVGGASSADA